MSTNVTIERGYSHEIYLPVSVEGEWRSVSERGRLCAGAGGDVGRSSESDGEAGLESAGLPWLGHGLEAWARKLSGLI